MAATVFNPFHKSDFPADYWNLRSVPAATHYVVVGLTNKAENVEVRRKGVLPCWSSQEAKTVAGRLAEYYPVRAVSGPPRNRKGVVIVVLSREEYPMWYKTRNEGDE